MRDRAANARQVAAWATVVCGVVLVQSCSNPERERLRSTTTATYDQASGKLTELTFDANKNGRIDTWTEMDGTRPLRSRLDSDEDGRVDRWEYYDAAGKLNKVTWCAILGVGLLLHLVPVPLPFVNLALLIAALVYLADVRPALAGLRRR